MSKWHIPKFFEAIEDCPYRFHYGNRVYRCEAKKGFPSCPGLGKPGCPAQPVEEEKKDEAD